MSVYPSRVDWWIAALLGGSVLFCLGLGIYLLGEDPASGWITIAIGILMGVVILLLTVPCTYTLTSDHLLIRSGLFKYRIAYRDITGVSLSSNPLSSPALSLKRIKISRRRGFVLVSPRWRRKFMQDINSRIEGIIDQ